MEEQPSKKERLLLIENDLIHLNRLQQRLSDWHSSVKESIRLKENQKNKLLNQTP